MMTGTAALNILFGAALVAIGVLAAALADRIRGLRISRDAATRERASRPAAPAPAQPARSSIPVVEHAELRSTPAKPLRAPRAESKVASPEGGEDVIAALVAAGYKKPVATEAAWACSAAERATVESWTASALRRCARGGMS
jgi:hypothetical protein